MKRLTSGSRVAVIAIVLCGPTLRAEAGPCEELASLKLPDTTIASATLVPAGSFSPSASAARFADLPDFCRVVARLTPSPDSDIALEVWLPRVGWNGKYQAVGNGGWAGSIGYAAMRTALGRGYATSSTDTGHAGGGGRFALGHPEKVIDYAFRSEHEMAVKAKAIIAAYYSKGPARSYWVGCSAGGKQALKEAQRFPQDFDGIIAGAPASDWIGRSAQALRIASIVHRDEASDIPPAKYALIHDAALQACDGLDRVRDGVIEDPARCSFDPNVLACTSGDGPTCLTKPQVETARQIYAAATSPGVARPIPGLLPGSELGWATWAGPQPFGIAVDHFRYVVFGDPNWDPRTFHFERDLARADQVDAGTINALDPNLGEFFERGGKLIQYHGWNDPQISPGSSVNYYKSVVSAMGGADKVRDSYRLFMVPGMAHCGGGEGPNTFDMLTALEQWVEKGQAPAQIIASRVRDGQPVRTRPLCPYPQIAEYKGTGSTDEAANFICR